jgi:hypothetical protein
VLVTLSATSLMLFIFLMGLMFWPDRSLVAASVAVGITPLATIATAHRFDFLLAILFWVVPSASAIGFAARKPQHKALILGLSISVLLFAIICFFFGRQDHSALTEGISVIAITLVLSAVVFALFKLDFYRSLIVVDSVVILLLFGPSVAALSRSTKTVTQPKELWATTLQQDQWQSMNTGSEYAATRQLAFAGHRVIAVLNNGFEPSQPSKEKWPVSVYRLVSMDLKTGAKLKEITITGRWSAMPYIYPTSEGFIDVQSTPPRTLDKDLMSITDASIPNQGNRARTQRHAECGAANCDPRTYNLGKNTLQVRQNHFHVVDGDDHVLSEGELVEWGAFAGASADGIRFAIQSSYTEGDPDFVVYEYFTIYDAATGKVLAMVHTRDLPARQSWSAFSSDGRYFAAGSPNKLTMYELR